MYLKLIPKQGFGTVTFYLADLNRLDADPPEIAMKFQKIVFNNLIYSKSLHFGIYIKI